MNNYDKMLADACRRFTAYDMQALAQRPGVEDIGACLKTCFLGETALLRKRDGHITVGGRAADFATENRMLWRLENTAQWEACPVFMWAAAAL